MLAAAIAPDYNVDIGMFDPIGHGGTERTVVYPVVLLLVTFGGYLLGTDESTPPTTERHGPAD